MVALYLTVPTILHLRRRVSSFLVKANEQNDARPDIKIQGEKSCPA